MIRRGAWSANPWIRDQDGKMLSSTKYNRIEDCTFEQLHVRRTGPAEYVLRVPIPQDQPGLHSDAKLRRWATALLLSSPDIPIGTEMNSTPPLRLRQEPPCLRGYCWRIIDAGIIEGYLTKSEDGQTQTITLHQADDGIHWFCHSVLPDLIAGSQSERQVICRDIRRWGLVFAAHPQLHQFPWSVPTKTSNRFITKALGKQTFRFHKKVLARQLSILADRLDQSAKTDEWQCAAIRQTPRQVWDHSNGLTPYQVWTGYRVATRQLNLYHAARKENNSCRKTPACSGREETIVHLFWDCACAAALWDKLVSHWTGQQVTRQLTRNFMRACASRRVQSIPEYRQQILADRFQDDVEAAERVWTQIWHVLATICQTRIWVDRNAAVFRAEIIHLPSSIASFWASCLRQLRAIAKREHRKIASAINGALLYACIELLERDPRGPPSSTVTSHDIPPDQPALTSWLRTFQRSCT